jgi:glucose dehydrogenase
MNTEFIILGIFVLIAAIILNIYGNNWAYYTLSGLLFLVAGLILGRGGRDVS